MFNHTVLTTPKHEEIVERLRNPQNLSEMEQQLRQALHWFGNKVLWVWLLWLSCADNARWQKCPHCQAQAKYKERRGGVLWTVFGKIHYRRGYYLCGTCHHGHYPLDEQLGLRPNEMSAEVERLAAYVGVQMPFEQGRAQLAELALIELSDHSLAKATQAYGQRVVQHETQWQAVAQDPAYLSQQAQQAKAPLRLYGTLDGGRVLTRATATDPQKWGELKIGAWFTARGHPPRHPDGTWTIRAQDITYYADTTPVNEFGELVWATGVQHHAERARELIFLGDGARWIWDIVDLHFPHAIQIVDWFHACEYLMPVAKLAHSDETQQKQWVAEVKTALWQGQLATVITACASYIDANRPDDPAQKAVTYYTNNRHRMDYPTYRAQGYQIGSGTIESGVKQIACQRLKVTGARWNLANAQLVAKARAAFLSGQWDTLATSGDRTA